jgi:Tol biopolymer transport system component
MNRAKTAAGRFLVLLAILGLPPASAQEEPDAPLAPSAWEPLDAAERGFAWAAFEAEFGEGWRVLWNEATGSPSMLVGPPIHTPFPIRADDPGIAWSQALLTRLKDVLCVRDPSDFTLERAIELQNAHGQTLVMISFQQTWHGLEVWHEQPGGTVQHRARVRFVFNATTSSAVLLGSDAVPDLALDPRQPFTEDQALAATLSAHPLAARGGVEASARSYVSVRGARRFVAREVSLVGNAAPLARSVIFDGADGALVEDRDEVRTADVLGRVSIGVLEHPFGGFGIQPANALTVVARGSGSTTTDGMGEFYFRASDELDLSGTVAGPWVSVREWDLPILLSFSETASPGAPENIVLNPLHMFEETTAEANAFQWTTLTHFFLQRRIPGFTGLRNLRVTVNYDEIECNAFFTPVRLAFARATEKKCENLAFLDVIAHEYGHAFHHWFHGRAAPARFSEGIGDHVSLYLTGQRRLGRNAYGPGTEVRDYRPGGPANNTQWPCVGCEVHEAGQVWAGFTIDLREFLESVRGADGIDMAEWITIGAYALDPSDEVEGVLAVYLLNDDNGTLVDGTPDCSSITAAALRHSLPVPLSLPGACGLFPPPPPATNGLARASVDTGGSPANGGSGNASVSGDGQIVAFESNATSLTSSDRNAAMDVFVRDLRTFQTIRASVASDGSLGNRASRFPVLSQFGGFVAFESKASNLVSGDQNGKSDIFLRNLIAGITERVSVATGGAEANGDSTSPALSGDERFVAFRSKASNLVAGDTNRKWDIFLRDRMTGVTVLASPGLGGVPANGDSAWPAISLDGRFVAFSSLASNLVAGDLNRRRDVFVFDAMTGMVERVSVPAAGGEALGESDAPSISGDGSRVVFASKAPNLAAGDLNGRWDVFLRDRITMQTTLLSAAPSGLAGAGDSQSPAISADGGTVTFRTQAPDLTVGDTNGKWDVVIRDLDTGVFRRISVGFTGLPARGDSRYPAIDVAGDTVVFESLARELVPGDLNSRWDIFVFRR